MAIGTDCAGTNSQVSWSWSHLFCVWIESVEGSELELAVPEEDEEVRTVALLDLLHHPPPGVLVDLPRQHHVLHRVHDDGPVGLADRLAVQPR